MSEPMAEPLIRPVESNDYGHWLPLWQAYQQFYGVSLSAEVTSLTWSRLLDTTEAMHAALVWQGGDAVGLVHYLEHRSCWTAGDYCYLQDLYVSELARGQGIGRALIAFVEREARLRECSRLYWLTQESNATARHLYDRVADFAGFIQYRKNLL